MSTYTQFLYQLVFGSKVHLPFLSSENQDILFGYSGFTYHISSKDPLISYVKNQAEHHKTISFKDELIRLLEENDVDYREDYLFT
jgi:hypothetical protein